MKEVHMKDVAKAADVSIATVSYTLNNVPNQQISEKTRERIFEACRKMGYHPNLTARTLASKKSGLIGILYVKDKNVKNLWNSLDYSRFLFDIEAGLSKSGYQVLFSCVDAQKPELNLILQRELDGVILLDVNEDMFYKISDIFKVPIIIVDGYLDDKLFHKVVPDYGGAIKKAAELLRAKPEFLIANMVNNKGVIKTITECAGVKNEDIFFAGTPGKLTEFLARRREQKGIVVGEIIGEYVSHIINPQNFVTVCSYDMPEVLPENQKKVVFSKKRSDVVTEIILTYLKDNYAFKNNKYTIISV